MSAITVVGITLLLVYGLTKILDFYGIGINVYGSYLAFYIFIMISALVLPREYVRIKSTHE
jgi:hypothetical protein